MTPDPFPTTPPPSLATFILTNRRPDRVTTIPVLRKCGYTGPIYLIVDDQDPTRDEYEREYPGQVIIFNKEQAARTVDAGDNLPERNTPLYARQASWQIARDLGHQHIFMLDDDYFWFSHRRYDYRDPTAPHTYVQRRIHNLNAVLTWMLDFLTSTPAKCIAMTQGGDHIGGASGSFANTALHRKVMNTFLLDTTRPFNWLGRLNDDVNTYTVHGARGELFFTHSDLQMNQKPTQTNPGGLTDAYKRHGTYTKSMYTVMMAPSCTRVVALTDTHIRLHHRIKWRNAAPLILHEHHRKPTP